MNVIAPPYSFHETEKRLQEFWDKNNFWENAPFIPYITEDLYQKIQEKTK